MRGVVFCTILRILLATHPTKLTWSTSRSMWTPSSGYSGRVETTFSISSQHGPHMGVMWHCHTQFQHSKRSHVNIAIYVVIFGTLPYVPALLCLTPYTTRVLKELSDKLVRQDETKQTTYVSFKHAQRTTPFSIGTTAGPHFIICHLKLGTEVHKRKWERSVTISAIMVIQRLLDFT